MVVGKNPYNFIEIKLLKITVKKVEDRYYP